MTMIQQQDAAASAADRFLDQLERAFYDRLNARMESREIERDMDQFRQRHELLQAEYDGIREAERKLQNRLRYAKPAEAIVVRSQIAALRGKRADVMVRMSEGTIDRTEAVAAIEEEVREETARVAKAARMLTAPVRQAAGGALDEGRETKPTKAKKTRARQGGRALPKKG